MPLGTAKGHARGECGRVHPPTAGVWDITPGKFLRFYMQNPAI